MPTSMFLVFELRGQLHALPAKDVVKVVDVGPLAPLPLLPPAVRGITHHRGGIVTVVDLGALLYPEIPAEGDGAPGRLVLVESQGRLLGLLVGRVQEILTVDPSGGTPPSRAGTPVDVLLGHAGRALQVLSTQRLLERIGKLASPDYSPGPRQRGAAVGGLG